MRTITSAKTGLIVGECLMVDEQEITKVDDMTEEEYVEYSYIRIPVTGDVTSTAYETALSVGDIYKAKREYLKRKYARQKQDWVNNQLADYDATVSKIEWIASKYTDGAVFEAVEVDADTAAGVRILKDRLDKNVRVDLISKLVVTTAAGNTFDADDTSRANMNEAITASLLLGQDEGDWKLADNSVITVSVDEIKEALALGIVAKGAIILE